jgi:hypothetical protein
VSNLDRLESRRYLEMFYALKYRKLVSFYLVSIIPTPCVLGLPCHAWVCYFVLVMIHFLETFQAESVPLAVE